MPVEFDPQKRRLTLLNRGIDMARADEVFAEDAIIFEDIRVNYGEKRFVAIGTLDNRMVVVIWTWRGEVRRIISIRKANGREQKRFGSRLEKSGGA